MGWHESCRKVFIAGKLETSYVIGGTLELVLPGETGFLLPPSRVAGMADTIVQLADDPSLRERHGQTGRVRFTDKFHYVAAQCREAD